MRLIGKLLKFIVFVCALCIGIYLGSMAIGLPLDTFFMDEEPVQSEPLVFDASLYPYYDQLTYEEKILYSEIYQGAIDGMQSIEPNVQVNEQQLEQVFNYVTYDHPEIFWIDSSFEYQYIEDTGNVVEITYAYNDTYNDLENNKLVFDSICNEIVNNAMNYSSDYDKEKYVHDALLEKSNYDANSDLNQSAYSLLVNGSTVCAGYAKSFQLMMTKIGIPCYYVTGMSEGEAHAWNIVLIDGNFYNVDVTWDDCMSDTDPYYFFNLDDEEFNTNHSRDEDSAFLPSCTSTALAHLEDADIYPYIYFEH